MKEQTISIAKANLLGLLFFLLISPLIIYFYNIENGFEIKYLFESNIQIIYFVLLFLLSVYFHELIHAIVFFLFAKKKWKSVKIGFFWKHLTPYAHCSEPLSKYQYALALILPGIILGVIPIVLAFINSDITILFYGLIMLFAAVGDFIILALLLKVSRGSKILDHSNKVGFWIISQ